MADITTLITGESGTGKALVARAIALSPFRSYTPFDASSQTFIVNHADGFSAVNLAALSPTLIESELFGHRRGAFTGAIEDHADGSIAATRTAASSSTRSASSMPRSR
jgi:transcriptional regulator with PAS, ATPase and Fis domain